MLLLLSGCFMLPGTETPVAIGVGGLPQEDCGGMSVAALYVELQGVDAQDELATSVEWRLASEDWEDAECGDESCTWWVAGYDVSGDMEVRGAISGEVQDLPGCEHIAFDEVRVTVEDDGCHPITEEIALVLDPEAIECDTGN